MELDVIKFKSLPRKTHFAPEWEYFMAETFCQDIDLLEISRVVLEKEKEILSNFSVNINKFSIDGYTGLGNNSLTSRYEQFNIFSWQNKEIQKLKNQVYYAYITFLKILNVPRRKVWIQCWANVMRYGEQIKPHIHGYHEYTYLGGHVSIQVENTSTNYINPVNQIQSPEIFESKNEAGKITIFQNCIPHYTSKHEGQKERVTIAFDIIVDENKQQWLDSDQKRNLILFDEV